MGGWGSVGVGVWEGWGGEGSMGVGLHGICAVNVQFNITRPESLAAVTLTLNPNTKP